METEPRVMTMPAIPPDLLGSALGDDSEDEEALAAAAAPDRSPAESGRTPSSSSSRLPPSSGPATLDGGMLFKARVDMQDDDAASLGSGSDCEGESSGQGCPYKRPLAARTPTTSQRREEAGARIVALAAQCRARFYRHEPSKRDSLEGGSNDKFTRRQRRSTSLPSMKMEAAATAAAAAVAAAEEVAAEANADAAEDKPAGDFVDNSDESPSGKVGHGRFESAPPNASDASDASPDTVLIFDWDDTLFPTWFITEVVLPCMPGYEDGNRSRSSRDVPLPSDSPFAEALRQHAITVRDLLLTACSIGRVGIVTLSQRPWVTSSARRYLLGVDFEQLLKDLKIPIVYARESIKRQYVVLAELEEGVNVFAVAKQRAMAKALKKLYGKSPWRNIISVGDANHEKDAIKELLWTIDVPGQERPPCCKTVKLMEEPSVEQLGAELLLLGMWLQSMVAHEEDFDVVMDDSEETMLRMHEQFSH